MKQTSGLEVSRLCELNGFRLAPKLVKTIEVREIVGFLYIQKTSPSQVHIKEPERQAAWKAQRRMAQAGAETAGSGLAADLDLHRGFLEPRELSRWSTGCASLRTHRSHQPRRKTLDATAKVMQ